MEMIKWPYTLQIRNLWGSDIQNGRNILAFGDWETYGNERIENNRIKNNLLYICQGRADVWLSDGFGHESHLVTLGVGALLGEENLLYPLDCNMEVEANDLVVKQFSHATAIRLIEANRELLIELVQSIAIKLVQANPWAI